MSTSYHHGATALGAGSGRIDRLAPRRAPRISCCIVFALLGGIAVLFAASALSQMRAPVAAHGATQLAIAGALLATIVALTAAQRVLLDLRWLLAAAPLAGLFLVATQHQPASRWLGVPLVLCGFLLGQLFLLRDRRALHAPLERSSRAQGWSGIAVTSAGVLVTAVIAASSLRRPPLQPKLEALEQAWNVCDVQGILALAPRAHRTTLQAYLERVAREQRWGSGAPTVTGVVLLSSDVTQRQQLFRSADERFVALRELDGSPLDLETTWSWGGEDWLLVSLALRPPS